MFELDAVAIVGVTKPTVEHTVSPEHAQSNGEYHGKEQTQLHMNAMHEVLKDTSTCALSLLW